tara:strand:+ start:4871 stop:5488 length:618 start_codon:yes stop_codon:yes gene_type:complete
MQKNDVITEISKFHNITNEEINNLEKFISFLLEYNKKINLIGSSTIDNIWMRHILDSAQLLEFITDKELVIADLGTGAGFPGIILSILGIKNIYLIEKSPRKCQFLREVRKTSPNQINILEKNIDDIKNIKFDVITSRAFAPLDKLLNISQNLLKDQTYYLLLKGKNLEKELDFCKKQLKNYKYQILDSRSSGEGKIIRLSKNNL